MKIAFIGAHGTGKTTMATAIAEHLELLLITERARDIARSWGTTPADIPADRLVEFQEAILDSQISAEIMCGESWVSDRSVIDNMAYLVAHADELAIPVDVVARYFQRAYQRLEHYDLLIWLPIMFPLEADGERHLDPEFQARIDQTIGGLIHDLELSVVPFLSMRVRVVTTEGAERFDEVMGLIRARFGHVLSAPRDSVGQTGISLP